MAIEFLIGLAVAFVAGGAIGSVGTLLAQWILKRVDEPTSSRDGPAHAEVGSLRGEVAEMARHLRNLDARLDFTERLLDGALSLAPPPERETEGSGGAGGTSDRPGS